MIFFLLIIFLFVWLLVCAAFDFQYFEIPTYCFFIVMFVLTVLHFLERKVK